VQSTITGCTTLSLDGAVFEFHGQQIASSQCNLDNWSNRCTEDSLKGSGSGTPTDTLPTHVVPEPMTMILLASGLAGMGVAQRRRRKLEIETEV
jgi:hypothetical protein